jgi:hypothetical protein
LAGFDLTKRSRCCAVQQKVRYSTDCIMKLRDNLLLADFVIEATKQSEPHTEGGR